MDLAQLPFLYGCLTLYKLFFSFHALVVLKQVRKREQARSQADKSSMGLWNIIPTISRSRSRSPSPPLKSLGSGEELVSTASSYESEERLGSEIHSDIDNTINPSLSKSNSFDRPIIQRESPLVIRQELSTQWEQQIPLETATTVVDDDFEEMTRLEATLAKKIPKQSDFVPTLSSSASVYVRKTRDAEVESVGDGYGMYFDDSSAPQSSRVRFAEHVKTKTLDDPSQPLSEVSPTSVMAMNDSSHQEIYPSSSSDLTVDRALPQPRRIMPNDDDNSLPFDEGRQSPYSSITSSEKPKSILRKGRSTLSDTSSTTDWQSVVAESSRSENSVRMSHAASAVPAEGVEYTRSITKSPPSTGFLDTDGSEISPILISGSLGDYDVHPVPGTDTPEMDDWQSEDKSARFGIPDVHQHPFFEERGVRIEN
jgi:hypothetical protein